MKMTPFNTSKQAFGTTCSQIARDFHAFGVASIAKGIKTASSEKRKLVADLSKTIEAFDTDDFGLVVVVLKTTG